MYLDVFILNWFPFYCYILFDIFNLGNICYEPEHNKHNNNCIYLHAIQYTFQDSSLDVQGMEDVRSQLKSMLKISTGESMIGMN